MVFLIPDYHKFKADYLSDKTASAFMKLQIAFSSKALKAEGYAGALTVSDAELTDLLVSATKTIEKKIQQKTQLNPKYAVVINKAVKMIAQDEAMKTSEKVAAFKKVRLILYPLIGESDMAKEICVNIELTLKALQ